MLVGLARPTSGTAHVLAAPAPDVRVVHRLLAHVPADVALWPDLTGAEIRTLLARLGPGVDGAYQQELVRRIDLDLDRRARTYSSRNGQKVALVAA